MLADTENSNNRISKQADGIEYPLYIHRLDGGLRHGFYRA